MRLSKSIDNLLVGKDLQKKDAFSLFRRILSVSDKNENEVKAALVLLNKKGETADELESLVRLARQKGRRLKIACANLVDGCGTGGDQRNTFNISTIAAFVAAGAGARVAKHGNRSITSRCGSSDLIEALGINLEQTDKQIKNALKKASIAYFHAPNYTFAFKKVAPIRRSLSQNKLKTIFNLVGPLLNPARVKNQLIGIFNERYLQPVSQTLKRLGSYSVLVIVGEDKTDELLTHQDTLAAELRRGKIKLKRINGLKFGLQKTTRPYLLGGNAARNKKIALDILTGKDKSARRDAVLLNAAAILYVCGQAKSLKDGVRKAKDSIVSGNAMRSMKELRKISHGS